MKATTIDNGLKILANHLKFFSRQFNRERHAGKLKQALESLRADMVILERQVDSLKQDQIASGKLHC